MPKWQNVASLVILQDDHILMRKTANGWQLPSYDDVSFYSQFHIWLRRVNDDLNGDFSIVRRVWQDVNVEQERHHQWFYMQNYNTQWLQPDTTQWIAIDELTSITLSHEIEDSHLQTMLDEITQPPHELCAEFMQVGWFIAMRDWVSRILAEHGYNLSRSPELFKLNTITALLRTETEQGIFYAKVENRHCAKFCNEARTLRALNQIAPEYIPNPLAIHSDTGMGIYANFGSTLEDNEIEDEQYRHVIVTYADLQQQTINKVDELIFAGCIDRRLNQTITTFKQIIASGTLESALTQEDYTKLVSQVDTIVGYCNELATYNIPHTLVHGDFHEGNIARQGDSITFFDWTDACIAHPFIDMCTLVNFKPPYREDTLFQELETAYLTSWESYETPEGIRRAYHLAKVLTGVHQIITYQSITQYSAPMFQKDFARGIVEFTQYLLEALETLS